MTVPRVGYRLVQSVATPPEAGLKPALAVMPFANLGDVATQDYFTDGVVEDIITALSKFKSFAVIARNSTFTYKGRAVGARQVADELGVRYVLEGSIRQAGSELRIGTQLVEATRGQAIWAGQFEGRIDEVFAFQDRITEAVAMLVEPLIQSAEIERARRERPTGIAAYDLYLRAMHKSVEVTAAGQLEAQRLIGLALEMEPQNPLFKAIWAWCALHQNIMGWATFDASDRQNLANLVRRALQDGGQDATIMTICGDVLLHVVKDYDWAIDVIRSAVELNPHNQLAVMHAGVMHSHCGSIEEAQNLFHRALRLSPLDPHICVSLTGLAHCCIVLGDFEQALVWARRSLTTSPHFVFTYWMLIAANAHLGHIAEAKRYLAEYRVIVPEATIARIVATQPDRDPTRLASILSGLRMAGMAEQ